jgi:cytochrome b subunit of formate dehydrogenase
MKVRRVQAQERLYNNMTAASFHNTVLSGINRFNLNRFNLSTASISQLLQSPAPLRLKVSYLAY